MQFNVVLLRAFPVMASRTCRLCFLAGVFLAVPVGALAQTATSNPEDEYKKLVKVDTEIQPLDAAPFGESINPYDGGLSFHIVDVSVPGNGPTIEIGRTFTADGDAEVRWNDAAFGDWELDIPRLTTMTSNASTIIAGPNQIGWLVNSVARTDRCTNFREPPAQRIGRPGTEPLSSEDWWNEGYTLYTPGQPSQDVLSRNATSPAAPQDGTVYQGMTKQPWHLGCLASTANGEAGEAFIAKGPDGTPADTARNIISTSDYKPYGAQALGNPEPGPGYTGHVSDPDSGLVYMQARYYDPLVGRFVGADPAKMAAGNVFQANRYAYGDNNPVGNVDPDGRDTCPGATSLTCIRAGGNAFVAERSSGKTIQMKDDVAKAAIANKDVVRTSTRPEQATW